MFELAVALSLVVSRYLYPAAAEATQTQKKHTICVLVSATYVALSEKVFVYNGDESAGCRDAMHRVVQRTLLHRDNNYFIGCSVTPTSTFPLIQPFVSIYLLIIHLDGRPAIDSRLEMECSACVCAAFLIGSSTNEQANIKSIVN